jgi:hypothetical protein
MKIGVVGSRDFAQMDLVEAFIRQLPKGITIVSCGAKGVDTAARVFGERYAHTVLELLPDLTGCKERYEFTKRYHERNQQIVNESDLLVAFTDKENGGTWDTIKRARRSNKPGKIICSTLFFPGVTEAERDQVELNERDTDNAPVHKTDVYHMKRITLGSFALNLKRHKDAIFLADFVNNKTENPDKFADMVTDDFIKFFRKYKSGHIDALTVAQRSLRNIDKVHPMDVVTERVAHELGVPFERLFKPWNKTHRGAKVYSAELEVEPQILNYIGKVVYVLDDVVTTGNTLKQACAALVNLSIHTHGIAYIFWS